MIRAIILDFGSVLYTTDWNSLVPEFKELFGADIGLESTGNERLIELYNKSNVADIDFTEYLKEAGVKDIKEALIEYKKMYTKHKVLNKGLLNLLQSLKEKYRLFGYTDIQGVHFNANQESGFHKPFEEVFSSFKFKSLKYEESSFDKLTEELKRYNLTPEDCLFIDDQEKNIANAKKKDFKTVWYKDFPKIEKLVKELKFLGVIFVKA
jgi:FMN phosphatase YigB (HAD superfamily)